MHRGCAVAHSAVTELCRVRELASAVAQGGPGIEPWGRREEALVRACSVFCGLTLLSVKLLRPRLFLHLQLAQVPVPHSPCHDASLRPAAAPCTSLGPCSPAVCTPPLGCATVAVLFCALLWLAPLQHRTQQHSSPLPLCLPCHWPWQLMLAAGVLSRSQQHLLAALALTEEALGSGGKMLLESPTTTPLLA